MEFIQTFFIFLITYFLILKISKFFKVGFLDVTKIYIFRSTICLAYLRFVYISSPIKIYDAYGYYKSGFNEEPSIWGTELIRTITFFLKNKLYLNHASCSLIYSFIGSIGIILLYSLIKDLTANSDKKLKTLAGLIVYMPILNMWTAAIGKDAITFTCINLIIFSYLKLNSRFLLLIISATFLTLTRPYIGVVLVFALFISLILKKSLPLTYKLFLIICILTSMQIILNLLFLKLGELVFNASVSEFGDIVSSFANDTNTGNTSIDISSYSFPMKIFSYLFRPLLFEANNLFTFLMSIENMIVFLVLLYPLLLSIRNLKFRKLELNFLKVFLIIFILGTLIPYAYVTSNLGLAYRHKLTLLPPILYISLANSKNKLSKSTNLV